jgi:transposase
MGHFLLSLFTALDISKPQWRKTCVFLLDNASVHKTSFLRKLLRDEGIEVVFTAPASFLVVPVEEVFKHMKL